MKSQFSRSVVSLLALLSSAVGMAATVSIIPSNTAPLIGEQFTLTVQSDVMDSLAATMSVAFDASKVQWVSGDMPAAGPYSASLGGSYIKNTAYTSPSVFDIVTNAETTLADGTYDAVILTFTALAAGAANIVINDDGGSCCGWFSNPEAEYIPVDYTQANVMIGTSGPVITVTDSVVEIDDLLVPFGQVTESVTSAPQTITVRNTGNANLVIGLVTGLAIPFALAEPENCSGATLEADEACTVTVDFTPASSGDFTGTLEIPSNLPTVTVSVSGTGTPIPVGNTAVTDSVVPSTDHQIPFGSITQNLSAIQAVTVTNDGNDNLTLGQVAMANPLTAPFSIGTDTCSNQVLAPAGTCSFQVLFEPTATGPFNDALDVPSDDPDLPTVTVSVTGTGVAVPVGDISVTDSVRPASDLQVGYGDVELASSVNETITVTNVGTGNLVIATVGNVNTLAAPFSIVTNTCSGQTLAPAATCMVVVAFTPGADLPYNDSFNIPSDDPDEPTVTVAVTGTGVPAPSGGGGSSAIDPAMVLALGLLGIAGRRRATARPA